MDTEATRNPNILSPKQKIMQKAEFVVNNAYDKLRSKRLLKHGVLLLLGPALLTTACDFNPQPTDSISTPIPTPLEQKVESASAPIATSTAEILPTYTFNPETSPIKNEVIDGIEVYGANQPVNSEAEFQKLNGYFNEQFNTTLNKLVSLRNLPPISDKWQQRELVLNSDERYLQVVVSKSVYDNFQKLKYENISLPEWLNVHIKVMNDFIENTKPASSLKIVLSRIIVVNDSFDGRLDVHQEVPDSASDIDGNWNIWSDLRGDVNPKNNQIEKSAFLRQTSVHGKNILIDYGMIHEWDHILLNWPDEYIQNVEGIPHTPDFIIEGAGGTYSRTPWFGYDLIRNQQLKIRGYYTDPRAMGTLGLKQHSDYEKNEAAISVWGEHPTNNLFNIKDAEGNPINGEVEILKNHNQGSGYYGTKNMTSYEKLHLNNGVLQVDEGWFEPERSGYDVTYPTNWILKIVSGEKQYIIHIPTAVFNITKLSGIDNGVYTLQFEVNKITDSTQTQVLSITPSVYPGEFDGKTTPYATMNVEGSSESYSWGISDQVLRYGMPK